MASFQEEGAEVWARLVRRGWALGPGSTSHDLPCLDCFWGMAVEFTWQTVHASLCLCLSSTHPCPRQGPRDNDRASGHCFQIQVSLLILEQCSSPLQSKHKLHAAVEPLKRYYVTPMETDAKCTDAICNLQCHRCYCRFYHLHASGICHSPLSEEIISWRCNPLPAGAHPLRWKIGIVNLPTAPNLSRDVYFAG